MVQAVEEATTDLETEVYLLRSDQARKRRRFDNAEFYLEGLASPDRPEPVRALATRRLAAVRLTQMQATLGVFFRALGGDGGLQIEAVDATANPARRSWMQKLAGANTRIHLAWRDERALRLPPSLAWFDDTGLNRDLYFWLTALGGALIGVLGLAMIRNPAATAVTLTLVAGTLFFAGGVARLAAAAIVPEARAVLIFGGVVSVGLGLVVLFNIWEASLTLLGILLGIQVLVEGLALLVLGRIRPVLVA
jgi:hypothetical protein